MCREAHEIDRAVALHRVACNTSREPKHVNHAIGCGGFIAGYGLMGALSWAHNAGCSPRTVWRQALSNLLALACDVARRDVAGLGVSPGLVCSSFVRTSGLALGVTLFFLGACQARKIQHRLALGHFARQAHEEGASLLLLAFHPNLAAMLRDNMFGDG